MMYRTELVEGITVENVTEKINAKIEEMEKESYRLVTMSFWGCHVYTMTPECYKRKLYKKSAK